MMRHMEENYLTKQDVMDRLHYSLSTVNRRIRAGLLVAVTHGARSVRIRESDLQDFIDRGCPATAADDIAGSLAREVNE